MSESLPAFTPPAQQSADSTVIASPDDVQRVLDALDDADCRAILEATDGEALSAREVADACDLPLSTAYRKLDVLLDGGLIEERTRIRPNGQHLGEYVCLVTDVVVSVSADEGLALRVSKRPQSDGGSFPVPIPEERRAGDV